MRYQIRSLANRFLYVTNLKFSKFFQNRCHTGFIYPWNEPVEIRSPMDSDRLHQFECSDCGRAVSRRQQAVAQLVQFAVAQ